MSSATISAAQEAENKRINAENERLRRKATTRRRVGLGFSYLALILVTILMLFPLIIVVLVSFTPNEITQTWPPKLIPSAFTLDNYIDLFGRLPIGRELLNTIVFAGAVTIISVFFDSLAAYGLSRVDFKGRGVLLGVLIATMMIPGMALLIPVYKLLADMGLVNSYLGIIIPRMADVGGIFLLRQFFISIPKDLDNAARIDGAGEFRIFAQIVLPNSIPAILTVGMFNFMGNWNDLLYPMMMTSSSDMRTLPAGLAMFVGEGVRETGPALAGALISMLPLLVLALAASAAVVVPMAHLLGVVAAPAVLLAWALLVALVLVAALDDPGHVRSVGSFQFTAFAGGVLSVFAVCLVGLLGAVPALACAVLVDVLLARSLR